MDRYDTSEDPPAPCVTVKIANPETGVCIEDKGKIDTGSYRTAFPESWVSRLNLVPASEEKTRGYKEQEKEQTHYTYYVNVTLKGQVFEYVEALAVRRRNVLIGRDILNKLKVVLDGKNLTFDVLDP